MKSGSIANVDSKDIAGKKVANEAINDPPIPHSVRSWSFLSDMVSTIG